LLLKTHDDGRLSCDIWATPSPDGPYIVANKRLKRKNSEPGQPKAVSLFSGAGGLDEGLIDAGWEILAQMDLDEDAVASLTARSAATARSCTIIQSAIEATAPRNLKQLLGIRKGELDLLAGGPPCQPFTTTGLRQAINDRRAETLFPAYLHYVDEFEPRSILIENVDGLLSAALRHRPLALRHSAFGPLKRPEQKGSFLHWFLSQMATRGYAVAWGVIEAADYGVPQYRQRAILIGVKGERPCYLPEPTHGLRGLPPHRTLHSALRGLTQLGPVQPLSLRKKEVYKHIPPGGNWRNLPREMQKLTMGAAFLAEGGKSGWWRRLAWDAPEPTILGMPDHSSTALIHPDELRCLSVAECAAVQTFPRNYAFAGSPRSQYQQIGNAVPPLLAKHLGTHLARFLEGAELQQPRVPEWRKASANRRIGTHGWVIPSRTGPIFHLSVKVRPDHIWATCPTEPRVA
jgi:DNA (cytosine-5)-methyltransferase 1